MGQLPCFRFRINSLNNIIEELCHFELEVYLNYDSIRKEFRNTLDPDSESFCREQLSDNQRNDTGDIGKGFLVRENDNAVFFYIFPYNVEPSFDDSESLQDMHCVVHCREIPIPPPQGCLASFCELAGVFSGKSLYPFYTKRYKHSKEYRKIVNRVLEFLEERAEERIQ